VFSFVNNWHIFGFSQKSGHDMARKKLLLDRQKEGKARLRLAGKVPVKKDVLMKVLRK